MTRVPRLAQGRLRYRGFDIEAVPSFNLRAGVWEAKALVRKEGALVLGELVEDAAGPGFSDRQHAVHVSLFIGRAWVERQL